MLYPYISLTPLGKLSIEMINLILDTLVQRGILTHSKLLV